MTQHRGALVGFGFIAENGHLPAYRLLQQNEADAPVIAAVADGCEARRRRALELLPGVRVYPDLDSLLFAEKQLDFVDICTPPNAHAECARAALAKGLHVLCEKPMASTPQEARAMLTEAVRAERVLFPCHNYKQAPVLQAVRRLLTEGAIGAVRAVTMDTFRPTHARGVAEWRPDWRRERRFSGGGIAMDHGSHTFYLAFEWMGGFPTGVSALASTRGDFDTEDDLSCTLQFPRGVVSARLTWNAGMRRVIYTIHGERGAIRVEDDELELTTKREGKPGWDSRRETHPSNWMDAGHGPWFAHVMRRFFQAIEARQWVGDDAIEALRCVELIDAAYRSSAEGGQLLNLGVERATDSNHRAQVARV